MLEGGRRLRAALERAGVRDTAVLDAVQTTPREVFVDAPFAARAHDDIPLPIGSEQTISQPSVVGLMTEALLVDRRCKVLEIGTGSGYQAAVLSKLCRRVYTIERHGPLAQDADARFRALGLTNVERRHGDGTLGWPEQAPFDRIMVTAAAEDAPRLLLDQLRVGGIMIVPLGQSDAVQELIKVEKTSTSYHYTELTAVRFVPLLAGVQKN